MVVQCFFIFFSSLNAGIMHFIIQGHDLDLCVKAGLLAAQHSLQSHSAVPVSIMPESFTAEKVDEWARFSAADVGNVVWCFLFGYLSKRVFIRHLHLIWAQSALYKNSEVSKIYTRPRAQWTLLITGTHHSASFTSPSKKCGERHKSSFQQLKPDHALFVCPLWVASCYHQEAFTVEVIFVVDTCMFVMCRRVWCFYDLLCFQLLPNEFP